MSPAPILFAIGFLLQILAVFMAVPAAYALATNTAGVMEFGLSSLVTLSVGVLLRRFFRREKLSMFPRQMFVLTTAIWLVVTSVAAVPLLLLSHTSVTDSFFETMSAITTTGATVLVGLDDMDPAILLWRSLMQWLGGIGFVVMGVAILPFLQVGGMRLFQTESSDWSDKAMPRARQVATAIAAVYITLTTACGLLYWVFGMSPFNAVNHAMTTVATAGFSTSDASFAQFEAPALHITAIIFMLLGSLPFILYVRMRHGDLAALPRDPQVRAFLSFLIFVIALLSIWLIVARDMNGTDALLLTAFNVVSVVTTTGFASAAYDQWGTLAITVFFYLGFVGGCSGSTSGGMKIFRFQLAIRLLLTQLQQLTFPRRVVPTTYNGRPVTDDIMQSVVAFSFAFFVSIAALAFILSAMGLDFLTALSSAATAVTNVGPALGEIAGPAGNFSSFPDAAKWAMAAGMLLGRLEVMTLLVLLTVQFWRN